MHKFNLINDIKNTPWLLEKIKEDRYAQNLYASWCNMRWMKEDTFTILKDNYWSLSWRSAGGAVAELRNDLILECSEDYMDWYCSGMGEGLGNGDSTGTKGYVGEGYVTEEIEQDLKQIGWVPYPWPPETFI